MSGRRADFFLARKFKDFTEVEERIIRILLYQYDVSLKSGEASTAMDGYNFRSLVISYCELRETWHWTKSFDEVLDIFDSIMRKGITLIRPDVERCYMNVLEHWSFSDTNESISYYFTDKFLQELEEEVYYTDEGSFKH